MPSDRATDDGGLCLCAQNNWHCEVCASAAATARPDWEITDAMVERLALRTFNNSVWVFQGYHGTEETNLWDRAASDLREKYRARARADLEAVLGGRAALGEGSGGGEPVSEQRWNILICKRHGYVPNGCTCSDSMQFASNVSGVAVVPESELSLSLARELRDLLREAVAFIEISRIESVPRGEFLAEARLALSSVPDGEGQ